jgi:hypothetical protein
LNSGLQESGMIIILRLQVNVKAGTINDRQAKRSAQEIGDFVISHPERIDLFP